MKPNYRIIRVEKQLKSGYVSDKKITMKKFNASNDEEAYQYLKDYVKIANKQYKYYYEEWSPYVIVGKDGKRREYDTCIEYLDAKDNELSFFKRAFNNIRLNLSFYLITRPKDIWYWLRNTFYFIKTKHNYSESWDIYSHILEDICWNIPILNKCCHGMAYPYLNKAVCETHKSDKNFDINEWNKTNHEYSKKEEQLAIKYQEESRNELLLYVKLYQYYADYGITDDKEFDKKWHHTLPIKKGTYDKFDYVKLRAMQQKYWNKIWEWMRIYGESLWD